MLSSTKKLRRDMLIKDSIKKLYKEFPFKNYLPKDSCAHLNVANSVKSVLPKGAKILDFGSGPCDKTAVLQMMGYECHAFDDLMDDWHQKDNAREKILEFAKNTGIKFYLPDDRNNAEFPFIENQYDMIMLHDVIEHLHESPKELLEKLVKNLKPGGFLFISVPNAVNVRKRLAVIAGKTNYPPFACYYNYPGIWRGHIREYVKNDLEQTCNFLGLTKIVLKGCDHMLEKVPSFARVPYKIFTGVFDSLKDSCMLIARKD